MKMEETANSWWEQEGDPHVKALGIGKLPYPRTWKLISRMSDCYQHSRAVTVIALGENQSELGNFQPRHQLEH